ncbi:Ferric iron reductase protein FhuF, involved in iron transport [Modestobacter sp. DSM 44400]|uniref:(2Fe-2S)-binding protein n=1 Tax=Modestobacter sp. DSM 44400 TaxID=1550230 RepID=UPI0008973004|nr:(2Fe-2S)-binding protein [Modestobacter sp. DSM 44400]SDY73321.1 Ferric iron reductase protein FhuF, involved in iron transport [Modestobacter sp. DSM 44400]
MDGDRLRSALQAGAVLSPFCALEPTPGRQWVSWADLLADRAAFTSRAAEVTMTLSVVAVPEERVVASLVHLGLVARLLAPALGAALAGGVLPVVAPDGVHVRLAGANPLPMALTDVTGVEVDSPAAVADQLARHWLTPLVAPWTTLVAATARVSGRVLAGNVTSAVAGALAVAVARRPDLTDRSVAVLDALLVTGPLAGTGGRRPGGSFVRRSCCLFYRLPGAGTCGDCVLAQG